MGGRFTYCHLQFVAVAYCEGVFSKDNLVNTRKMAWMPTDAEGNPSAPICNGAFFYQGRSYRDTLNTDEIDCWWPVFVVEWQFT